MQYFSALLWRDSTTWRWKHRKDLTKINRDLKRVVVVEVEPKVCLQKENTILIKKFDKVDDTEDRALMELIPFLECKSIYIIYINTLVFM